MKILTIDGVDNFHSNLSLHMSSSKSVKPIMFNNWSDLFSGDNSTERATIA